MSQRPLGNAILIDLIREKIALQPKQSISFREYMELCLYESTEGYYVNSREKIGKAGDYYTSDAMGGLLGEMLAKYIVQLSRTTESVASRGLHLIEWGGGTGRLALQVLDEIAALAPDVYGNMRFTSVELSLFHRETQANTLRKHLDKVDFVSPENKDKLIKGEHVVVYSNELVDAFPVHKLRCFEGEIYELYVGWDEQKQQFYEINEPLRNESIIDYLLCEQITLADRQTVEINLAAQHWISELLSSIKSGTVITIDYGDLAEEIYAEHRMNGTLLCYYKHQASEDCYARIGVQDITAHVNFSALINAGKRVGVTDWTLRTQKQFLIDCGILKQLSDHSDLDPFSPVARRNRAIRQILLSAGMSELFKVLVQTKHSE